MSGMQEDVALSIYYVTFQDILIFIYFYTFLIF